MTERLRVLVVTSERGAADLAIDELTEAGHDVARCTADGEPSFPCAALIDDARCPLLEQPPVDVVLDVRPRPRAQPAPGEAGVTCALQHHVPLVVAGATVFNPFESWATEVVPTTFDIAGACERAARAPLPRHSDAATRALLTTLGTHGVHGRAHASVFRHAGRLTVQVASPSALEPGIQNIASVRILAALRALDPFAAGVDVCFTTNGAPADARTRAGA
jgi:hypothetical protein